MLEVCLGCFWEVFGKCLGSVWECFEVFGSVWECLGSVWEVFGSVLEVFGSVLLRSSGGGLSIPGYRIGCAADLSRREVLAEQLKAS